MTDKKDFIKSYKENLEKKTPKGVNPDRHERCVKEVKKQGKDVGSAHAICTSSMKKASPKEFVEEYKKSIDYRDFTVSIDTQDQHNAELTVDKDLINYIKSSLVKDNNISKIDFMKGQLTLDKKAPNLFSGFFQDNAGQIVEKFDNTTAEIIAKNLAVKELADMVSNESSVISPESSSSGSYVKLKFGDFEFEMKKSLSSYLKNFKKIPRNDIKKSVNIWKKSAEGYCPVKSEMDAVKEILENWDHHGERFQQILFAVQQGKKK